MFLTRLIVIILVVRWVTTCQTLRYIRTTSAAEDCPHGFNYITFIGRSKIECSILLSSMAYMGFAFPTDSCDMQTGEKYVCRLFSSGPANKSDGNMKALNLKTCTNIKDVTTIPTLSDSLQALATTQQFVSYLYTVYTAPNFTSGTDGTLNITAVWSGGFIEQFSIDGYGFSVLDTSSIDKMKVNRPYLGDLKMLNLTLTIAGIGPDWLWSKITVSESSRRILWTFVNNIWIGSTNWKMSLINPSVSNY